MEHPIDDAAVRDVLDEILRCRQRVAALMHMPELQQVPVEYRIRIEDLAGLLESTLEMLALHHHQIIERASKLRSL
jgi:hypothetical protein